MKESGIKCFGQYVHCAQDKKENGKDTQMTKEHIETHKCKEVKAYIRIYDEALN